MDVLSDLERQDPIWLKVEEYLNARREKLVNMLIAKESEEIRGRIKEIGLMLTPPAETPTAKDIIHA